MSIETVLPFARILEYLDAFTNYERVTDYQYGPAKLGTERIGILLEKLGKPHLAYPCLHIAGTKGKGSVCHLGAKLLEALGYKVGLFASPHLCSLRERIQIDNSMISEQRFCEVFTKVQAQVETMRNHPEMKPPTYFEILTATAFAAFAEEKVDVAVMEVGLGGRLDATNVPDLCVAASGITTISLDHRKILGDDLLTIAGEKAGIIRPGVPLVISPQVKPVEDLFRRMGSIHGCRVLGVGREVEVSLRDEPPPDAPEAPQRLDLKTWQATHHDVPLPMLGRHQADNAALALALCELFLEKRGKGPVDTASLRRGWREAGIPGRIEVVAREPWVILDGAHNAASIWALCETLTERFSASKRVFVFGSARDKEIASMLRILAPLAETLILTSIPSSRSIGIAELETLARENGDVKIISQPDPEKALETAIAEAGRKGLVCATGSLYLAGYLREKFVPID
jgi:dihydrofolate synthase/folylpolyglutamate synthase